MVSIPVESPGCRGIASFQAFKFRWDINRPRTSSGIRFVFIRSNIQNCFRMRLTICLNQAPVEGSPM